ncbi:MAG TPA: ABC transporter substrate-binding protein, partial [Dongiaceae bacterium]|nr:ABC transporter substrate-binding protein [Dongiaceae bacterium]
MIVPVGMFLTGCSGGGAPSGSRYTWVVGQGCPAFDPAGPPDPVRWSLERLCSRGLVERDSTGRVTPMAAERIDVSGDSLTWTFHLRPGLAFTDGTPCTSGDFARAIEAGLARRDHSTVRWLLGAVAGL